MAEVLQDSLDLSLQIVFCGTAAGTASAKAGAYYAHPQNKFWMTLHDTGLTPRLFEPHQYRELLPLGIGLTDLVKTHFGMDHEIPLAKLRGVARERLRASIERCRPQFLAFTSMKAGTEFLGGKRHFGKQAEAVADTEIWILPSPSGAARGSWRPEIWHRFAERIRAAARPV
jgi:TDG/mug DNA glycosylase family protein